MSMTEAEQLKLIEDANRQMAKRAEPPVWYHPTLGLLMGGLLAVQELPVAWVLAYEAAALAGIALLAAAYRKHTGMWIPGYRAGRTRWVAIGTAATAVAIFLPCVWLRHEMGVQGACLVGGAVLAVLVTLMGHLWMKAYRRDLGVDEA
jgi:hypothetical protein